jgi:hypothetical protein
MKKCPKCGQLKDLKCFSRDKSRKDGLYCYCKTCHKHIQDADRKRIKERKRQHYLKHRKEKIKSQQAYCEEHKEKIATYNRAYQKIYYSRTKNTLRHRYKAYKGDARRRGVDFLLTVEEFGFFWQQPCEYCGIAIDTVGIDRRDSQKGYELDNCVSCCSTCNLAKGQLTFDEWMMYLEQVATYCRTGLVKQVGSVIPCDNLKMRYGVYRHNAKRKNLMFELTLEQFKFFSSRPCEYCGRAGVVGIDRVDNSIGYKEDNCVPCCKNCNSGKNNGSLTKWLDWRTRVAERRLGT